MAGYTGSSADAGRLLHLAKRREREKEDMERKRRKIADEVAAVEQINNKFATHYDAVEHQLKTSTIGLVSHEEMKAKQGEMVEIRENQLSHKRVDSTIGEDGLKDGRNESESKSSCLSFNFDDNDDDDDANSDGDETNSDALLIKKVQFGKDPSVNTSFLPDREREMEENKLREQLRQEWVNKQEILKLEEINVAFSYWDGSGHRRDLKISKGSTIQQFLHAALEELRKDFNELRAVTADSLMFVKEDLTIPHFYTFYDFIVTRAMGKTGPLFAFDAAGELRVRSDVADNESHPAKVVLRSWYERNKHIYPASRWEPFDPIKKYSGDADK